MFLIADHVAILRKTPARLLLALVVGAKATPATLCNTPR